MQFVPRHGLVVEHDGAHDVDLLTVCVLFTLEDTLLFVVEAEGGRDTGALLAEFNLVDPLDLVEPAVETVVAALLVVLLAFFVFEAIPVDCGAMLLLVLPP